MLTALKHFCAGSWKQSRRKLKMRTNTGLRYNKLHLNAYSFHKSALVRIHSGVTDSLFAGTGCPQLSC